MSERKEPLLHVHARVERTVEANGHYIHLRLHQEDDNPWVVNVRIDPSKIGGGTEKVLARLALLAAEAQRAIKLIREVAKA